MKIKHFAIRGGNSEYITHTHYCDGNIQKWLL